MKPYAAGVRQHETHSALAGQTGPQDTILSPLDLDAPIERVASLDTPMPYNRRLERAVLPSVSEIVKAAERIA